MAHVFDEIPKFGGFGNLERLPTWAEVMSLINGTRPDDVPQEYWEKEKLDKYKLTYMIPRYTKATNKLEVGTQNFKKLPIKGKEILTRGFEELYLQIIEITEHARLRSQDQRKLALGIQAQYREAKQKTSDDRNYTAEHRVNFEVINRDVKSVVCILRSCVQSLEIRGNEEQKAGARKFNSMNQESLEIINQECHTYMPVPDEDNDLWVQRTVDSGKLQKTAKLFLDDNDALYNTTGASRDVELIIDKLQAFGIQKDDETNQAYVDRMIEMREEQDRKARSRLTYRQHADRCEIPPFLKEDIIKTASLTESQYNDIPYLLEVIDNHYLNGNREFSNKTLWLVSTHLQEQRRCDEERRITQESYKQEQNNKMAEKMNKSNYKPEPNERPYGGEYQRNWNSNYEAPSHETSRPQSNLGSQRFDELDRPRFTEPHRSNATESGVQAALSKLLGEDKAKVSSDVREILDIGFFNPVTKIPIDDVEKQWQTLASTLLSKSEILWGRMIKVDHAIRQYHALKSRDAHYAMDTLSKETRYDSNYNEFLKAKEDFDKIYYSQFNNNRYNLSNFGVGVDKMKELSQTKSQEFEHALRESNEYFVSRKLTNMKISESEAKMGRPEPFTGDYGVGKKSFWEFMEKVESFANKNKYGDEGKVVLIKDLLEKQAKVGITDEMKNYRKIVEFLTDVYGNFEQVFTQILDTHQYQIGHIPSASCPDSRRYDNWKLRTDKIGQHIELMERAENLNKYYPGQIYCSRYAGILCKILPPEEAVRFVNRSDHYGGDVVKEVKEHLTDQFAAARKMQHSSRREHSYKPNPREQTHQSERDKNHQPHHQKEPHEKAKNTKFTGKSAKKSFNVGVLQKDTSYQTQNREKPYSKKETVNTSRRSVGGDAVLQTNLECLPCKCFQISGHGEKYFERHIFQGGRSTPGHCPNYNKAPPKLRNRVLKENNVCVVCIKENGENHVCRPGPKALCAHCDREGKKIRVENCQEHKNMADNKKKIENKEAWFKTNGLKPKMVTVGCCGVSRIDPAMEGTDDFLGESAMEVQGKDIVQNKSHFLGVVNCQRGQKRKYEVDEEELNSRSETKCIMKCEDPLLVYGEVEGPEDNLMLLFDSGAECSLFRDSALGHRTHSTRTGKVGRLRGIGDSQGVKSELWQVNLPITLEYAATIDPENTEENPEIGIYAYSTPKEIFPVKPNASISEIFEEVKEELKETESIDIGESHINSEIQLDGIIGMDAIELHPEPLCSTDAGYTIYKSKLRTRSGTNYCIGGSRSTMIKSKKTRGENDRTMVLGALQEYGVSEGLRKMDIKIVSHISVEKLSEDIEVKEPVKGKSKSLEIYEASMSNTRYGPETPDTEVNAVSAMESESGNPAVKPNMESGDEENPNQVSHIDTSIKDIGLLGVGNRINEYYSEVMEGYSGVGSTIFLDNNAVEGDKVLQSIMNVRDSIRSRNNKDLALALREDYNKVHVNNKCFRCLECAICKKMDPMEDSVSDEHRERVIMKSCIKCLDNGQFQHKLPFKIEEEQVVQKLRGNSNLALQGINRQIKRLKDSKESDQIKIKSSFEKLVEHKYIVKFDDLSEKEKEIVNSKEIQVFIVWNVVFKPSSLSTPCRVVFNASQKIGRYSLNDMLMKGHNKGKMDFEKIAISMAADHVAIVMDISKFYNSLLLDPEHYNYQNIYWCYDIHEEEPKIERHIIKTCIYGVSSSSAMTELCMEMIAEENSDNHELVRCFKVGKYVDDICTSRESKEVAIKLKDDIVSAIGKHNMKIKGYALSGEISDPKLVEDGLMHVGGYVYNPLEDILMIGVPMLDFTGSSQRGRVIGGEFYKGSTLEEMENFVPENLTIRITASKTQGVFDCRGIFSPWRLKIKHLQNESRREVTIDGKCDWDMPLSAEIRKKWVELFHEMTLIKKMKFKRFCPSKDADTSECTIFVFTDAAELGAEQVVYVGYRNTKTNLMEVQYLTSRNQILEFKPEGSADKQHISRKELESFMLGICLGQKCKTVVKNATKMISFCDNKTALCWTRGEPERLIGYIRKRVKIINQFSTEDDRYYIKTGANISDLGTRVDISVEECGPDSTWYRGPRFLADINKAIEDKIIEPLKSLAPSQSEKETLADGCGGQGHQLPEEYFVMALSEVQNEDLTEQELEERIANEIEMAGELNETPFGVFAKYNDQNTSEKQLTTKAILATAHEKRPKTIKNRKIKNVKIRMNERIEYPVDVRRMGWIRSVNVVSIVMKFVDILKKRITKPSTAKQTLEPLTIRFEKTNVVNRLQKSKKLDFQEMFKNTEESKNYRFLAVEYLLKLASLETRKMYSKSKLDKLTYDENEILYARSRVPDFTELSALLNDVELKDIGIQSKIFFIGRFTALTLPIIEYFHYNVSYHGGRDSTLKHLNSTVAIYKGTNLVKQFVRKCIKCRIKNKQKMQVTMGPITNRLRYTYVNSYMFLDGSGPYMILKNKTKMNLRGNPARQKVWVLHSTCAISHYSRAEIMSDYSTSEFLLAFTRICGVTGYPKVVYLDSDTSEKKGMMETTFNAGDLVKGLEYHCDTELRFCGTTGQSHSRHGAIEARIKSFKKYLNQEFENVNNMTFTMFTTAISLVTNILNSCPLALKQRSNIQAASFVTPFTFVQGVQSAERIPLGIGTQSSRQQILESIEEFSKGLYSFYSAYISSFLLKHKWSEDTRDYLNIGDIVLFEHTVSEMASNWKLGRIAGIEKDSDGEGRIVKVMYSNSSEMSYPTGTGKDKCAELKYYPRYTRRGTHTIVKIYNINETGIDEDISELIMKAEDGEKCYFNKTNEISES